MLCDVCHQKNATVHLTEIINEKVIELHICQSCAQAKTEQLSNQLNIPGLLGNFFKENQDEGQNALSLRCSVCGLTYGQFKKIGRFGCSHCYTAFKKPLAVLLKRIHGVNTHVGKIPLRSREQLTKNVRLEELRQCLQRAVQMEEYEEAARLRDQIKSFE